MEQLQTATGEKITRLNMPIRLGNQDICEIELEDGIRTICSVDTLNTVQIDGKTVQRSGSVKPSFL